MRIFLIRHCESEANVDVTARARHTDHDIPLSENGVKSREALGKALNAALGKECKTVQLFHSPYLRVRQTVEGIMPKLDRKEVITQEDPSLTDMNKGSFWPFSHKEREKIWGGAYLEYKRIRDYGTPRQKYILSAPNGESLERVVTRMRTFVDSLKEHCAANDDIVIVGHDATLSALLMVLKNVPEFQMAEGMQKELHPNNASIRLLEGKSWDTLRDKGYKYKGTSLAVSHSVHH